MLALLTFLVTHESFPFKTGCGFWSCNRGHCDCQLAEIVSGVPIVGPVLDCSATVAVWTECAAVLRPTANCSVLREL